MKNRVITGQPEQNIPFPDALYNIQKYTQHGITACMNLEIPIMDRQNERAEILFLTSYPPRECGIATYSQDLIKALNNKFSRSLSIKVCALESGKSDYEYPDEVKFILDTSESQEYKILSTKINSDNEIKVVLIQHEFGFYRKQEQAFLEFVIEVSKPVVLVFHTVLPHPDEILKSNVRSIVAACQSIIVMTNNSADILMNDYGVKKDKITVIAHGTHLVPHMNEKFLKIKYGLKDRKVLTTFGLLSQGKSIETTLDALPAIIKLSPEVVFLVIGKTHPEVVKSEGEAYREMLEKKVVQKDLQDHVIFINQYLALPELLEYLQLTDIYLFTSNDPNQAVSGTFAYAMSCACPIISTPIPHAKELLTKDTGVIFDFRNSGQLADEVIQLLNNEPLRKSISLNCLQKIISTAWENSSVSHALLLGKIIGERYVIKFDPPIINLDHLKQMTTDVGMIQFSKINQPDIHSGYTLDDNARALVSMGMYYSLTGYEENVRDIHKYLQFVLRCQQPAGNFLNYLNGKNEFTDQNQEVNLDDANGRAIWALGYTISLEQILPEEITSEARIILEKCMPGIIRMHSTRAMAFAIKGLYYFYNTSKNPDTLKIIEILADRLLQMYRHESNYKWNWFEGYLTYANSILPEALLYAWMLTGKSAYQEIAVSSFDFLISQTFNENGIEVISNKKWLLKGHKAGHFGEQPIDVAYTVMALGKFYEVLKNKDYFQKMGIAFNWFLGSNRLQQIIYNPCTGGCYDGLEETNVNLNQGAESTVSYLMARLTIENYRNMNSSPGNSQRKHVNLHTNQRKFMYSTDTLKQRDQPASISLPLHMD